MARQDYSTFYESRSIVSTTTGVDADVIYTVPSQYDAEVTFLSCTNGSTVNSISIQVYHADDNEYHYLLRNTSVPDNEVRDVVNNNHFYLHAGDKVVAYKTGGTFDVSISGKQFYNPSRGI